jgi:probable F420-dependent oxidoreductase
VRDVGSGKPDERGSVQDAILGATGTLVVGTSIVDIWTSDGDRLAASHRRIREAFPGRFYLGVGSGHAPAAEARGQAYTRPLSRLKELLGGALASVPEDERMIAALGPRTLEAAGELTAGALPYLMPPAHTAEARRILGDGPLLVPEQKVFLGTDADVARRAAVVWGDDAAVRAGIDAHLGAGADHVAIQVLTEAGSPRELPLVEWRRLAGLLGLRS